VLVQVQYQPQPSPWLTNATIQCGQAFSQTQESRRFQQPVSFYKPERPKPSPLQPLGVAVYGAALSARKTPLENSPASRAIVAPARLNVRATVPRRQRPWPSSHSTVTEVLISST